MRREDYLAKDYTEEDKRLIRIFTEEVKRLDMLYYRAINSNDTKKANELVSKIRQISNDLKEAYWERADEVIPKEYLKWTNYISDLLYWTNWLKITLNASEKEVRSMIKKLGPAHIEAVNALLNTSKNYVKSSLDWMERQAMTMISELQWEKVREELAKWTMIWENLASMEERIKRYFQENKISWFKDRSWRLWSMDRYVDMLTRTETSIANIQGTINRAIQLWITKFKIVEASDCCEYCAEYNWEIVDIKDWAVDLPPFHPNCRWYIIAVDDELNEREVEDNNTNIDDIQNIEAKTPEERIAKSLDIIENSTMYLNHEQEALINMDWKVIRMASWTSWKVYLKRDDILEPYIMTHNHPNSSSFSWNDFKNWLNYDNEYWLRASSKVWTYSIYAERKIDKVLFLRKYDDRKATKIARKHLDSVARYYDTTPTKKWFVELKDWTTLYYKDNPYEVDKFFDENYWKYFREEIQKAADDTPWVKFEFIPSDWIEKWTKLNKMYLEKVEEVNKLRRKWVKIYEDKIELNDYI